MSKVPEFKVHIMLYTFCKVKSKTNTEIFSVG